jgi:hypothetical protein
MTDDLNSLPSLDLFAEEPFDDLAAEELPAAAAHGTWSTIFCLSSYGSSIATLGSAACSG